MGIKRLYNYLSYAFEKDKIQTRKDLNGVTVGIDAMGWLYQAYFGYCEDSKDVHLAIIRNIELKVKHLETNDIDFYFVIDGRSLDCKSNTQAYRDKKREKHLLKSQAMEQENYDIGESSVYKKYSEKISKDIIYFFIDYLKIKNYKYIVSPYESDSQLYYLYKNKIIQYIISEDSDIAAFGCNHIIKCFRKNGDCQVLNKDTLERLRLSLKKPNQKDITKKKKTIQFFSHNIDQRIEICIACGCDYLENIKGVGFGTIIDQIDKEYTARQFLQQYCEQIDDRNLKLYPDGVKNQKEYLRIFDYVKIAFQQQIVYDIKTQQLKNISSKGFNLEKYNSRKQKNIISYIGDKDLFKNPEQFCTGNQKFDTMQKRSFYKFDYQKAIRFINCKPKQKIFTLSNLCCKNYCYDNFEEFIDQDENDSLDKTSQTDDKDKNSLENLKVNMSSTKLKVNQLSFFILNDKFRNLFLGFFQKSVQSLIHLIHASLSNLYNFFGILLLLCGRQFKIFDFEFKFIKEYFLFNQNFQLAIYFYSVYLKI